jgi:hypothetical protein
MPHTIHGLSLTSVPLTVKCNNEELFLASGFFVRWQAQGQDRTFLVTNGHVITGCHPITKDNAATNCVSRGNRISSLCIVGL